MPSKLTETWLIQRKAVNFVYCVMPWSYLRVNQMLNTLFFCKQQVKWPQFFQSKWHQYNRERKSHLLILEYDKHLKSMVLSPMRMSANSPASSPSMIAPSSKNLLWSTQTHRSSAFIQFMEYYRSKTFLYNCFLMNTTFEDLVVLKSFSANEMYSDSRFSIRTTLIHALPCIDTKTFNLNKQVKCVSEEIGVCINGFYNTVENVFDIYWCFWDSTLEEN